MGSDRYIVISDSPPDDPYGHSPLYSFDGEVGHGQFGTDNFEEAKQFCNEFVPDYGRLRILDRSMNKIVGDVRLGTVTSGPGVGFSVPVWVS